MTRPKRYLMKLPEREIQFGDRTLVMGILNITPDSFSDGDKYMDPDRAVERALELEALGADIIDIGGESTRPGAERVEAAEELRRIIPVLKKLKGKLSVPISVDTYKAEVAAKAIERGAEIVNDPSGLTLDLNMPKVVGDARAGVILNHMRGTPETWSKLGPIIRPMRAVVDDLAAAISRARNGGIDKTRIIADPGLGFGKRGEQNYELLARLGEMVELDVPIMAGPSRKSFLGQAEMIEKDRATAAAVTVAVLHGAHIVRVHDIAGIRAVLQTVDSIVRSLNEEPAEPKVKKSAPPATIREIAAVEGPKPVRPPRVFHAEDKERPAADDRSPYRKPYERDDRPPYRGGGGGDRPPYRSGGGDRPPYRAGGDRPFRKDGPPSGDRPPYRGGGGDKPPYRAGGDRPFRKDGPPRGDRPPYRGDGPPRGDRPFRKDGPPSGDRPPYRAGGPPRDDRGRFRSDGPPRGDRPFRKDGPPRGDRPPFRSDGPPRGDRPPYRGDGPPRGDRPFRKDGPPSGDRPPFRAGGPPRGDRPPFRGDGPPRGDRPFRKDGPPRGGKPGFKGKGGGFKPPRPRRDD